MVTRAFLPALDEYTSLLKGVWESAHLTNRGALALELEEKLKSYLGVPYIIATNNGTVPLQIALKLLANKGEVITTPFSYIATTSAIVWENCSPVFVDIHPQYLTIDESKIEEAITPATTALLATHVYGNPCNVEAIENIAKKHGLSVIYDAAHCFGVKYKGKSIFNFGDVSTCSFHATKLFHTGEGGAMFTQSPELYHKLFYSHNFGHNGPEAFEAAGINGKISELQAAMGLAMLPYMEKILSQRKAVVDFYNNQILHSCLRRQKIRENTDWNYSYYPIVFESEEKLLEVQKALMNENIFSRRYFYPSLNTIEYVSGKSMPVSESVAKRVLCLPLYAGMEESAIAKIADVVNGSLK